MQTLSEIRSILSERGLKPRHALGQNFLHDQNQLRRLLEASGVGDGDVVLEVGPGTGTLTEALLERGCTVIACELDENMADILEERLGTRITLVRGDCLDRSRRLAQPVLEALDQRTFSMVANLPYGSASPLMSHLATMKACRGQWVTIQREVADRLLGAPGTRAYGPLTIFVGMFAAVQRIGTIPPSCFWPQPKVDSAMVAITPRQDGLAVDPDAFGRFVHLLFSRRRKQLGTILGRETPLPDNLPPETRPEMLTIPQIHALFEITQGTSEG